MPVVTVKPADFPTTVEYNLTRLRVMATAAGLTELPRRRLQVRSTQIAFESAAGYRVRVFLTKTGRISYAQVTQGIYPTPLDEVAPGTKRRIVEINKLMIKWAAMTDADVLDLTNR